MKEDGSDDFQGILKEIQRKDHTIQNPKFWVFDQLSLNEFDSCVGQVPLSARLKRMQFEGDVIEALPQYKILSKESLDSLKKQSRDKCWEGLIARRDVGYEGDRTKNMLKLKEMHDAEYVVLEAVMGPQRVIVEGREVEEQMLSAVIIEHKGGSVQVGSGFSLEERRRYYHNPEEIVGCSITAQYFEETVDQEGKNSLRFPVFKANHGKTREV
jgi:DNA ligase-1